MKKRKRKNKLYRKYHENRTKVKWKKFRDGNKIRKTEKWIMKSKIKKRDLKQNMETR